MKIKKKIKTNIELMQEDRKTWTINPVTRVHDNDEKRNIKKLRRSNRKLTREAERE